METWSREGVICALARVDQNLRSPDGEVFVECQDLITRETLELARQRLPELIGALKSSRAIGCSADLHWWLPGIGAATEEALRLLSQRGDGKAVADALVSLLPLLSPVSRVA